MFVVFVLVLLFLDFRLMEGFCPLVLCSQFLLAVLDRLRLVYLVFLWGGCRLLCAVVSGLLSLCSLHFLRGWKASHSVHFFMFFDLHPSIIFFKWSQLCAHYFLVYLFHLLYKFQATMCPSSGEPTLSVLVQFDFDVLILMLAASVV